MKKHGFTLVEMLSVIVILGILALITIPTVNKIMKNAKISTFESSMVGLVNAGKLYYQSNTVLGQTMADKTFTFPDASGLEINGEAPKSGSMIVSSQGKIALAVSNGEYCAKKGYDETEISINEDIDNCVLKVDNNEESDTNIETILLAEDSKKLGGELPEYYATKSELEEILEKIETYDVFLNKIYPVGSIYTSTINEDPANILGGEWSFIRSQVIDTGWQDFSWTNSTYIGTTQSSYTQNKWRIKDNILYIHIGAGSTSNIDTNSEDEIARIPIKGNNSYSESNSRIWIGAVGASGSTAGFVVRQNTSYISIHIKPHNSEVVGFAGKWYSTSFAIPLDQEFSFVKGNYEKEYFWKRIN